MKQINVNVGNRKVRKDFDMSREYSVDVSGCTEEEKKEVQKAFFDVGIFWRNCGKEYHYLDKVLYSNTSSSGRITKYCMYDISTFHRNMSAKEFLVLVYEPENQGHAHAELMALYAEDEQ